MTIEHGAADFMEFLGSPANLLVYVDRELYGFTGPNSRDWFGVGVVVPPCNTPIEGVVAMYDAFKATSPLIELIQAGIGSVDEDLVAKRTAAIKEHTGLIKLDIDCNTPHHQVMKNPGDCSV